MRAGSSPHAIMGGSNIIWFDVFSRVHAETQGIANAYFIISRARVSEN